MLKFHIIMSNLSNNDTNSLIRRDRKREKNLNTFRIAKNKKKILIVM